MYSQRCKQNHTLYFSSSTLQNLLVENITNQQVGARIARVRVTMELTQAELASEMTARLGREVRPLTVTRLEGGKRPIGVDELVAAAESLNVKPEDLLSDNGLPMGSVRIVAAYQGVHRAHNLLTTAVQQYVSAQNHLHEVLAKMGDKYLGRLPVVTRMLVQAAATEWTVDFVVGEAQKEKGQDDDSDT